MKSQSFYLFSKHRIYSRNKQIKLKNKYYDINKSGQKCFAFVSFGKLCWCESLLLFIYNIICKLAAWSVRWFFLRNRKKTFY